ncbi:RNA-binding cell elongation regulator Jag/EloR [Longirhabdus pacifica]|uniref:RNA-binding cell elongation regulator Jag/EloR n=1 Tax=Longirhabdus pacifica TaxID=2305227 RepID=UPI001009379D|nr:RNA-binding cell elongation regulator Jag/EloR [Longirhabdus pacifica]
MKITVSGKSIEKAIENGLKQLGTTKNKVNIHVVEQPSKGFLGLIGSKEAKVELKLKDPIEEAKTFIHDAIHAMDLDVKVNVIQKDGMLYFNLTGSELGILIGKRGQTLDALQYLVKIIANRYSDKYIKIVVDAEEFRARRKKTLEKLSLRLADKVMKQKRDVMLEPMNPHERKIIHAQLQDHKYVRTYSKGEEPNRRIIITLK